jgi:hypothetical protein
MRYAHYIGKEMALRTWYWYDHRVWRLIVQLKSRNKEDI